LLISITCTFIQAEETCHEENENVASTEGTGHVLEELPLTQVNFPDVLFLD
jgi:hypothetical protein